MSKKEEKKNNNNVENEEVIHLIHMEIGLMRTKHRSCGCFVSPHIFTIIFIADTSHI